MLILGAGASKPYGYPTALELRKEIITNLIPRLKYYNDEHNKTADFDNEPYIKKIKGMISVFKNSSTSSIDLFLSRNNKYYVHGKQVITFLLANYELESNFREDIKESKYDWYFNLYEVLTKGIISPDDVPKFSENKISIITFNYDRSFEHFIYDSLINSFTSKREEIHKLMQNFKVIHVYGKLADLPWESVDGVDYRSTHIRDFYDEYCKNIQIIYDERKTIG